MVKPRPRKTDRGTIPPFVFEEAAKKVMEEKQSVRKVAKEYGMCHVTLSRFVISKRSNVVPKFGYNPHNKVFTAEQEKLFGDYCKSLVDRYYSLAPKDFRKLAYQFAIQNGLKMPDKWSEVELASEDWLAAFFRRNTELHSLRSTQVKMSLPSGFSCTGVLWPFYRNVFSDMPIENAAESTNDNSRDAIEAGPSTSTASSEGAVRCTPKAIEPKGGVRKSARKNGKTRMALTDTPEKELSNKRRVAGAKRKTASVRVRSKNTKSKKRTKAPATDEDSSGESEGFYNMVEVLFGKP